MLHTLSSIHDLCWSFLPDQIERPSGIQVYLHLQIIPIWGFKYFSSALSTHATYHGFVQSLA